MDKKQQRMRRATRTRCKIKQLKANRLSVHKTSQHIYAQVITPDGNVVASASTIDKTLRLVLKNGSNILAASQVGKLLAERALAAGIDRVAVDRSGFKYHGRVKVLVEAAREGGINC